MYRGRFGGGGRGRGPTNLPPDLVVMLDAERKKRVWRRYLPLWGGAVAVGLTVGIVPSMWPSTTPKVSGEAVPKAAIQTMLDEVGSAEDRAWANGQVTTQRGTTAVRAKFGFCHIGGGTNCVVDGDTIWLEGQNIRIADIDAPETHEYDCPEEKALGDRATLRLQELVNSGPVSLSSIDRDQDVYGRKLRLVYVNGQSVGDTLVGEGLARYYRGGKRPWC